MLLSKTPDWLREPDIRTYIVEPYIMDYLINGEHTIKAGYLLTLHRNGKIRQSHFLTNRREAEKQGKRYMKEEGTKDN